LDITLAKRVRPLFSVYFKLLFFLILDFFFYIPSSKVNLGLQKANTHEYRGCTSAKKEVRVLVFVCYQSNILIGKVEARNLLQLRLLL